MCRWLRRNWLALIIGLVVLAGFATLYNDWLAFSALATLLLALAAFWTIWMNRQTRREDREKERKARSSEELCRWAEEALRLYYLPYNYYEEQIAQGLIGLVTRNMLMSIAATIIGEEFIEPTKRAERALEDELEGALYPLLTYLYVLRFWDYDYGRFLDDAIENGVIKPKYKPSKEEGAYVPEKNQQS